MRFDSMSEDGDIAPPISGLAKRALILLVLLAYFVYIAGFLLDYGLRQLVDSPPIVGLSVPTILLIVVIGFLDRFLP